jgi:hypothetical protein
VPTAHVPTAHVPTAHVPTGQVPAGPSPTDPMPVPVVTAVPAAVRAPDATPETTARGREEDE